VRYLGLATDFDGTIAHDGIVNAPTLDALHKVRAAGLKLILVTGRELGSLFATFDGTAVFDRVVAENGALIYEPAKDATRVLAAAPPQELIDLLTAKGVPFRVGRSVVDTVEPYQHVVLESIRALGLEWHVAFNKGAVMALPPGITKATGLKPVLEDLGLAASAVVGVGDAENDHAFLQMCGQSVAVANALPAVKDTARLVMKGARGDGVIELIDLLLSDRLP
jgi:hydroxymethylpyrimidine pyrophosphatase-like HAD family hydrolase